MPHKQLQMFPMLMMGYGCGIRGPDFGGVDLNVTNGNLGTRMIVMIVT